MRKLFYTPFLTLVLLLSLSACGDLEVETDTCPQGTERCPCYPNQTCNDGLACFSDICVSSQTSNPDKTDGDLPDGSISDGDEGDGDLPNGDLPNGDIFDGDFDDDTSDGTDGDTDLVDDDTSDGTDGDTDLVDGDMDDDGFVGCEGDPLCENTPLPEAVCDDCGGGRGSWSTPNRAYRGVCSYSNSETSDQTRDCTEPQWTPDELLETDCVEGWSVTNLASGVRGGYAFQCVEYVRRFAYLIGSGDGERANRNACNWWKGDADDQFENEGTEPPQEGDLIVFWSLAGGIPVCQSGFVGHIGVISQVKMPSGDEVGKARMIDQNLSGKTWNLDLTQDSSGGWSVKPFTSHYITKGWIRLHDAQSLHSCGVRAVLVDASGNPLPRLVGCPDQSFCLLADKEDSNGTCVPFADETCEDDEDCPPGMECRSGDCVCSDVRVNDAISFDFGESTHCFRPGPWEAGSDGCSASLALLEPANKVTEPGLLVRDLHTKYPQIISPPIEVQKDTGMTVLVGATCTGLASGSSQMKLSFSLVGHSAAPQFVTGPTQLFTCDGLKKNLSFELNEVTDSSVIRRLLVDVLTGGENFENATVILHSLSFISGGTECVAGSQCCELSDGAWTNVGASGPECNNRGCKTCQLDGAGTGRICQNKSNGSACGSAGSCDNGNCTERECTHGTDACCTTDGYWVGTGHNGPGCTGSCEYCEYSSSQNKTVCVYRAESAPCNYQGSGSNTGYCNVAGVCIPYPCPPGSTCCTDTGQFVPNGSKGFNCQGECKICNGSGSCVNAQDGTNCPGGQCTGGVCRQCECSSGTCCSDGCTYDVGKVCQLNADSRYTCSGSCGGTVNVQYRDRLCPGGTSSCTGSNYGSWKSPQHHTTCAATEQCIEGQPSCSYSSNCCQCTGGDCCSNGCNFDSSSKICNEQSDVGYQCSGTACGSNPQRRYLRRHCSGSSASCTGSTSWGSWTNLTTCNSNQLCKSSSSNAWCETCPNGCQNGQCANPLTAVPTCPQYTSTALYSCHGGANTKVFKICATVDTDGMVTVKVQKTDGTTFGSRPYHVREFSDSVSTSQQCKHWNIVKASNPAGIGTSTLTFPKFDPIISAAGVDAYCVTASTQAGDPSYDPSSSEQTAWWCSGKLLIKDH